MDTIITIIITIIYINVFKRHLSYVCVSLSIENTPNKFTFDFKPM